MNRELKMKIVRALLEDRYKGIIESEDIPEEHWQELDGFLGRCWEQLEMMVQND